MDGGVREHGQDELRRTRDQLAEAQRLARLGSWVWDIRANQVTWSDELFRVYGLEPGEIEPSYEEFLARVHPEDRESVDERNQKAFADHQPFEDVKRCVRPDGTEFLMRTKGEVVTEGGEPVRMLGICEDVTAQQEAEHALAELASIVQSSDDAIIAHALDGRITSWNRGAVRMFGFLADDALGRDVAMLIPPEYADEERERIEELSRDETVEHFETRRLRRDGSLIDVSIGISAIRSGDGRVMGVSLIARDITERKRFEAQLQRLADHDPLTGLFNRRRFEEELAARVAEARRYGSGGSVLMLDLDNFKYVNDALGHSAGDELVRSIAAVLRSRLRETDVLARLGGDEFAVLQVGANQPFGAKALATRLIDAISAPYLINDHQVVIGTSIGIALAPRDADDPDQLLKSADMALYRAKGESRGIHCFFEKEMDEHMQARRALEMDLRKAVINGEFELYYQPIINIQRNELVGFEALLRWRHPERGTLSPADFMPVAEETGFIVPIGEWVLREACTQAANWPEHIKVAINLSPGQLRAANLLPALFGAIAASGITPNRIELEITEAVLLEQTEPAIKVLRQLQSIGVRVALDDFGAGCSSLGHLRSFPFDKIKIDRSFVSALSREPDGALAIVRAMTQMGMSLGMVMMAEGVETVDQLEFIRAEGCTEVQGFFFSPPKPAQELASLFATQAQLSACAA